MLTLREHRPDKSGVYNKSSTSDVVSGCCGQTTTEIRTWQLLETYMTNKEKLRAYESFFHSVQMYQVCCRHDKIQEALNLIFNWSYSHRCGNGELSDKEQQSLVDDITRKMSEF